MHAYELITPLLLSKMLWERYIGNLMFLMCFRRGWEDVLIYKVYEITQATDIVLTQIDI